SLPELNFLRGKHKTTPILRHRNGTFGILGTQFPVPLLKPIPPWDFLALLAHPCADLTAIRTTTVIHFGLVTAQFGDLPPNTDLSLTFTPPEYQGGTRILLQLPSLSTAI